MTKERSTAADTDGFRPSTQVAGELEWDRHNKTVHALHREDALGALAATLERAGFRRLSPQVRRGAFALVFEASHHQIIRVVKEGVENERSVKPYVLQPVTTLDSFPGYRIEILPKVQMLSGIKQPVDEKVKERLLADMVHGGEFLWDPSSRNIGIIQDKAGNDVPVVMDAGATVNMKILSKKQLLHFMLYCNEFPGIAAEARHVHALPAGPDDAAEGQLVELARHYIRRLCDDSPPAYHYAQAQQAHRERLGLRPGKIQDVMPEEKLAGLYQGRPRAGVYNALVADDKLYLDEIKRVIEKAATQYRQDARREVGFCQHIHDARAKPDAENTR